MKKKLFILFLITTSTFAQRIQIWGSVYSAKTKDFLVGATIFNIENKKGTQTDFDGKFSIKVNRGTTITFSYLGYKSKKITFTKTQDIKVFLEDDINKLNEVVIKARKNINDIDLRKVTSAITTIKPTKIKERPSVNVIETLQGQFAGVSVKTSGELGQPVKIRIRGTSTLPIKVSGKLTDEEKELLDNKYNQPLFVLDGQIISSDAFAMLNVNDIAEMKVLKDATANALYGVKASNGVVEITSKRGVNGKTQYTFSMQQGITFKGKPAQKMMNTEEKLAYEYLSKNSNTPGYYLSEEYIRRVNSNNPNVDALVAEGQQKLDSIKKINTNWFDELARISTYNSYNLSTRGGNETNKFYVSGNFSKQGGKFEGNDIQKFTGRLNYEYQLSKSVYAMLNSGFSFSENNTPNSSDYAPSELMYKLNPYEQKNKGELISYSGRTFNDLVHQYSKNTENTNFNFSGNLNAKLHKNLHFASIVGIQYGIDESIAIVPPDAYNEEISASIEERGKATKHKTITSNLTTNTRLNYNKDFDKHSFSLSANIDYYKNTSDFVGISGYGLPSKLLSGAGINNDIVGSRSSKTISQKTTDATLGYGFSVLYAWNDMFNVYGSYKRDASSLLPKDKRWNTFYAVGLAFTLNSENSFLKNTKAINSIGFRSSYGKTASLSGITASLAVPTFAYGSTNYLGLREFSLKDLFNEDLRPEESTSINFGVDINFLKSITVSTNIYHRRTNDMLLTVPIAPSNGFNQQLKNVGVMDNQGIEFAINVTPIRTDDFVWNTSMNFAYNENKVVDLYDGEKLYLSGNPYPDYQEGESANILYGLQSLGVNPADGKPYFLRADGTRFNGDAKTPNEEDFVVLGKTSPPLNGGWYNSFSYKNFQFSFDLYFSLGGMAKKTNTTKYYDVEDAHRNLPKDKLSQTWFNIGDEGKIYPTIYIQGTKFWENVNYANTDNTEKTDFVRMNNIMLKYRCNPNYLERAFGGFVKNGNCYVQLKNIGYLTNFSGGDPESVNVQGSAQPILTVGLNVGF